jgi:hypothetical protein
LVVIIHDLLKDAGNYVFWRRGESKGRKDMEKAVMRVCAVSMMGISTRHVLKEVFM